MIPAALYLMGRTTRKHAVSFAIYSTVLGLQYMLYEDWISGKYALFIASNFPHPTAMMRLAIVMLADLIIVAYEINLLRTILSRFRTPIPSIP